MLFRSFTGTVNATNGTFTGTVTGSTISGGSININNKFIVNSAGVLNATGATITGAITATSGSFTGTINATNGTFRGTVTGSRIEASSIAITDKFSVTSAGILNAKGATIVGNITADNLEVKRVGTINLTATGSITGGTITGTNIRNGAGTFIVTDSGHLTARSADIIGKINATELVAQSVTSIGMTATGTISGGALQGSRFIGGNIYVPSEKSPNFRVESNGNMMCNNATVNGTINSKPGSNLTGHIVAESLTLTGSIPPEIDNGNVTTGSIGAATSSQVSAAQNAANAAQSTANTAQGAANTANSGVSVINGQIYLDQSNTQIKSSDFLSGSRGWAINRAGSAEFNNVIIRGAVYATSGSISGSLVVGQLTAASIVAGQISGDIYGFASLASNNQTGSIRGTRQVATFHVKGEPLDKWMQVDNMGVQMVSSAREFQWRVEWRKDSHSGQVVYTQSGKAYSSGGSTSRAHVSGDCKFRIPANTTARYYCLMYSSEYATWSGESRLVEYSSYATSRYITA